MIHSFKLLTTKEKLLQKIAIFAKKSVETKQVASRLLKLLPERLKSLTKIHKVQKLSASRAERRALCDERYRDFVLEYLNLKEESLKTRVQWETHRMYFYAKKSKS